MMTRRHLLVAAAGAALSSSAGSVLGAGQTRRILVVYYSRRGLNYAPGGSVDLAQGYTEVMAKRIAAKMGADLFEVDTVKPYPKEYRETTEVVRKELSGGNYPQMARPAPDLTKYDVIFFGHPIWWGEIPPVMQVFLKNVDMKGKKVVHFCTHAGSGFGQSDAQLKAAQPGATYPEPLAVAGSSVAANLGRIDSWVEKVSRGF